VQSLSTILHLTGVTFDRNKRALRRAFSDVIANPTFQASAALSYYSILSIFPALILLSAVMAHVPLPNFFSDVLVAMTRVLPKGTMPMVYSVLVGVLGANLRAWLSFGTIGTVWIVSSAFDEMIDALNLAYDATEDRPFWKRRLLAIGMSFIIGFLLMFSIALMVLGARASGWLAAKLSISGLFIATWPLVHAIIAIAFALLGVQTVYFLAPNVKQRFLGTLPGAILSVAGWMGLSALLGIYFRYFSNYNRIYGTLGGVMVLMTWLYWAYFIFLAGGELNAELAKERNAQKVPRNNRPSNGSPRAA
jgi:membrane protein